MEVLLSDLGKKYPRNPALIGSDDDNDIISFDALSQQVEQLRENFVQCGVSHGSVVALTLQNSTHLALIFLALLACDATIAPLNPKFKASEYEYYLEDADAQFIVAPSAAWSSESALASATDGLQCARLECFHEEKSLRVKQVGSAKGALPSSDAIGNTALILHTSGTTGKPKRVPLTLANLLASTHNVIEAYKLDDTDRTVLLMPLFHIHGIVAGLLAPLLCGAGVVIPVKGVSDDFWQTFVNHNATWWTATPTHQNVILGLPKPTFKTQLRFIRSCSSALSPQDLQRLEEAFGVPVLQAYAMTENAHHIASQVLGRDRKPGSVGYPSPNVDVVVVDDAGKVLSSDQTGEIAIKGKSTTLGYLGNPEANAKAFTSSGHFRTGDRGFFDKDGCLFLTGRLKEMINKGGESLSPVEIDNVLVSHEKVAEAVSFAVPDEVYGEDIGAAIVLAKGQKLAESELIAWLREKVSETKLPKTLWFVDAIPKTATGKLQRLTVAKKMLEKNPQTSSSSNGGSGGAVEDLRKMWSDVLRISASEIKDSDRFSVLSGDSGLAVRLAGMARTRSYTLSLANIFAHDELAKMATEMHPSKATDALGNGDYTAVDKDIRALCAQALPIKVEDVEDAYPMTPFQSHMAAENLESGTWNYSYGFRCETADLEKVKQVMDLIQHRHGILRAHTVRVDGQFYQAVTRGASDCVDVPCVKTYLRKLRGQPIPLGDRSCRFINSNEDGTPLFVLTLGHVIMDEWTRSLIFRELETGLKDIDELRNSPLPPPFGAFARWIDSVKPSNFQTKLIGQSPMPYDKERMKPLTKSVKLDRELPSDRPWFVATHLAWALATAEHVDQSKVTINTVQSGRLAPMKGIESILGPTLTHFRRDIDISSDLTLQKSLDQIADSLLAPENASFAGTNLYEERHKVWMLNCALSAPLATVNKIGQPDAQLELDQNLSDRLPPGFALNSRAFRNGADGIELRISYDNGYVNEKTAEATIDRFAKFLSQVCRADGERKLGDIVKDVKST
ncbi:Oxalate--CoA ligase [Cercospora beticola]|uniref:Oxalate--CoA ligase n=1 Tax=Cercospora beticola TaxID=122368 RepID=A0A2G5HFS2_CERBT|nr:Oxalate--CoA ligase [Cercospora beticola]PIA91397.1 Oxalate--CoA ligase [Cercospora beticola]WPB06414.1 hypothetical protein RHO25_011071 [Cercospora beticola]CAK1366312.1 unnamed protein product [Cercospora beticola]